ncbi:uncharacterized protein [Leptinotarsa decemlineata]|uniref:uncharacterized protein n=1 Tax=Leptinotarsa decemlineata TaxID=7539 RepID=UPI003D30936D
MPGSILNSQIQQFVLNLCKYFERERAHGGPLLPFSSVQERVADALEISQKTVFNIKQRNKHKPITSFPEKSSHRIKKKTSDLPEGQKMEVRNTLYDMYKDSTCVFWWCNIMECGLLIYCPLQR